MGKLYADQQREHPTAKVRRGARVESAYFAPLSSEAHVLLRERLQAYRDVQLDRLLGAAQDALAAGKLGAESPRIVQFLTEVSALSGSGSPTFGKIVNHWGVTFLLRCLLDDDARRPGSQERLISSLSSLLLFERLLATNTSDQATTYTTTTDGQSQIYSVRHDATLRLRDQRYADRRLTWEFSTGQVVVQAEDQKQLQSLTLSLPLGGNALVELEPFPRAEGWNIPVIEDSVALGIEEFGSMSHSEARQADEDAWQPLSLPQSLERAYGILEDLWPEVVEWTKIFVPAFADMGETPSASIIRSGTHGPGFPIFMTKVADPFLHAEGIVHELQHQRLQIFFGPKSFGQWNDLRREYVSPYRSDPRPLRGLHLGLHAFVAMNELRLRALHKGLLPAHRVYEMLKLHRMNLFAFRTLLEHETFSSEAKTLFAELARELSKQHRVLESMASPGMAKQVDQRIDEHVSSVRAVSEGLRNESASYRSWDEIATLADSLGREAGVDNES